MLDLSYLHQIGGDDEEFVREILQDYLQQMPLYCSHLHQAIAMRRLSDLQNTAHKMKSLFRLLHVLPLQEQAAQIEQHAQNQLQDWQYYKQRAETLEQATLPIYDAIRQYLDA